MKSSARIAVAPAIASLDVDLAIEAATEHLETKLAIFRALDDTCAAAGGPGEQYVVDFDYGARRRDAPARARHRHAFHEPRAGDAAGRDHSRHRDVARDVRVYARAWPSKWARRRSKCATFPGFVSNRVLMPMINEAIYAVYEGVATPEAVDTVMKLGMNHPMGPLTLADFIGLDTCLAIMDVLYYGFRRFEIPRVSAAAPVRCRRLAREEERPRILLRDP